MGIDFKDVMLRQTDEELVKIVTVDRENYQPLAIMAAEEEIKKRNISTAIIEQVKNDLTTAIEKQKEFCSKQVSLLTRLVHFIVDSILFNAIAGLLYTAFGLFVDFTEESPFEIWHFLFVLAAFFGYYIFMETTYQTTVGKLITKTRVVMKDGNKPGISDIIGRTACRLIPLDPISFLFVPDYFHDFLSGTTVVKR
jgi:Predicted membrane protein/domain